MPRRERPPKRHRLAGWILLALLCVAGAELVVCRFADPALFAQITAPVTALAGRLGAAAAGALDRLPDLLPSPAPEAPEETAPVSQAAGEPAIVEELDNIYGSVEVVVDESLDDWAIVDPAVVDGTGVAIEDEIQLITRYKVYNDAPKATLLYTGDAHLANGGSLDVAYSYVEDGKTFTGVINGAEAKIDSNKDYSVQKLVVDFTGLIPDNADGRIITITDITAHLNITNKTGITGMVIDNRNDSTPVMTAGKVSDIPLSNDGYTVAIRESGITAGTKATLHFGDVEVDATATDKANFTVTFFEEEIANLDINLDAITLTSVLKISHENLDRNYWSLADGEQVNEITINATLGTPIDVTIYRTNMDGFHANDTGDFETYGDTVESTQLVPANTDGVYKCTFKVSPDRNLETITMPKAPNAHGTEG